MNKRFREKFATSMTNSVAPMHWGIGQRFPSLSVLIGISLSILLILGLATFQDLMESIRKGHSFYLGESLLFKSVWPLFLPILAVVHQSLKKTKRIGPQKMIGHILVSMVIHLLSAAMLGYGLSMLFFDGRYDLLKFLTYFLVHDIMAMMIIHSGFVWLHRYFPIRSSQNLGGSKKSGSYRLAIRQGNQTVVVPLDEIVQIRAATPYISIHLENRKYLHFETLKGICRQLDGQIFMRVHKSIVVNLAMVESFRSRSNGDYDLLLKNGESIRLSRTYAKNFKAHFKLIPRDTL